MRIGATINAFGRKVVLTQCDGFTQEYLHKKYGIEEFNPIATPVAQKSMWNHESTKRILPPFNNWGSHEDSEGSKLLAM